MLGVILFRGVMFAGAVTGPKRLRLVGWCLPVMRVSLPRRPVGVAILWLMGSSVALWHAVHRVVSCARVRKRLPHILQLMCSRAYARLRACDSCGPLRSSSVCSAFISVHIWMKSGIFSSAVITVSAVLSTVIHVTALCRAICFMHDVEYRSAFLKI